MTEKEKIIYEIERKKQKMLKKKLTKIKKEHKKLKEQFNE